MSGLINVLVAVISFVITSATGLFLIPLLTKIKFGQTIKEIGPIWHRKKNGTPTMGGFMFIIGIFISSIIGFIIYIFNEKDIPIDMNINIIRFFAGIGLALAFGFVGFVDDYIKVVKKHNLGLKARQKTVMQIIISISYILTLYIAGDTSTILSIPFIGQLDIGYLYYPLAVLIIIGAVNAVNLTDGIDGLASSVTFIVGISFIVMCSLLNYTTMGILSSALTAGCLGFLVWNFYPAKVFTVTFIVGISFIVMCSLLNYTTMGILSSALTAGCLGFLVWNFYPAKVFMGDTGSMFLGGAIVAIAFGIQLPIILCLVGFVYLVETLSVILQVISFKLTGKRMFLGGAIVAIAFGIQLPIILCLVGFVYLVETLSVILQVISFKLTGKRIFKMSPIHHHFEMSGWSEVKIVIVFSLVSALFCSILQVISFKLTGKRIFKMSPIHHHFEMSGWSEVKIVIVFSLVSALFCSIAIYSVTAL